MTPRAIGIVRVSQPGSRSGESFVSPRAQREAIEKFCAEHGWRLLTVHDELHVSGDALLEARPGLSQAVTAVLTGAAEVIVGAHAERLWWSHEVRAQVLRLVHGGGGEVWSVDSGCLSNGTAAEDFNGEVRTSADRFSRRQNGEKSRSAVVDAVARGVWPAPRIPLGYVRGDDKRLAVDARTAPAVAEAFALRASGATIGAVRVLLSERGVAASYAAVQRLLASRAVLGEVHHGKLSNLQAHEAIVGHEVWAAAQRVSVPAGRRAKSERLLARLGVLRCGSCGGLMSASTGHGGTWPLYKCGAHEGDGCPRRMTIGAEMVEGLVVEAVRTVLADDVGRAEAQANAREASAALEAAQTALDAAVRQTLGAGLADEPSVVERLAALRAERDEAQVAVERLAGADVAITISASKDWERLTADERRALIRATIASVSVAPGRGPERIRIELLGH